MSKVAPKIPDAPSSDASEKNSKMERSTYYADKAALEQVLTDSICGFVFRYGGRLNVNIEAIAQDTHYEVGQPPHRKVYAERISIITSKD